MYSSFGLNNLGPLCLRQCFLETWTCDEALEDRGNPIHNIVWFLENIPRGNRRMHEWTPASKVKHLAQSCHKFHEGLRPTKHGFHLVWCSYVISTAISTDLKVAGESKILGKEGQHYRKRKICFGQYRWIFQQKKWRSIFFTGKNHTGGGV